MELKNANQILAYIQGILKERGEMDHPFAVLRTESGDGEMIGFIDPPDGEPAQVDDVVNWLRENLPKRTDIQEFYLPIDCVTVEGQGTTMSNVVVVLNIKAGGLYRVKVIEYDPSNQQTKPPARNSYWESDEHIKRLAAELGILI